MTQPLPPGRVRLQVCEVRAVKVRFKKERPFLYLKVTAVPRGTVESNRRRITSPYDEKHDTAGASGEPALSWRSPTLEREPMELTKDANREMGPCLVGGDGMVRRQRT